MGSSCPPAPRVAYLDFMPLSLVLQLLFSASSSLPETPEAVEALRLYGDLEYEAAEPILRTIATNEELTLEQRATAWLWVAICQADVGADEGSGDAMREALELDFSATLPMEPAASVREMFAAKREEVRFAVEAAALDAAASAAADAATATLTIPDLPPPPGGRRGVAGSSTPLPPLALAGGGVAVVGVAAAVTGVVFGIIAQQQIAIVDDPTTFQDDAQRELDSANSSAALGLTTGIIGGLLVTGGLALLIAALTSSVELAPGPIAASR